MATAHKYIRKLESTIDNLRLLRELAVTSREAARLYGQGFLKHFQRGWKLVRRHKFRPREAFDIGLFDRAVPESDLCRYASKQAFSRLQAQVNPLAWYSITEDKGMFYRYCLMSGIPTPRLYAIFYRGSSSWTLANTSPQTAIDWQQFLETHIPGDFVVKPTNAAYGSGLSIYSLVTPGRWLALRTGVTLEAGEIAEHLLNNQAYPGYILQERLRDHKELHRISDAPGLQTMRIITHVTRSGECQILHAAIKFIVGESLSDNFDKGKTGNLMVRLDIRKGVTTEPLTGCRGQPGVAAVAEHPQTHLKLTGIPIPYWKEVCELARTSAYKFLPIRAIGWDIAVTDAGPVAIEANMRFDPPNQFRNLDTLCNQIANT
jgi:hypothetical protein